MRDKDPVRWALEVSLVLVMLYVVASIAFASEPVVDVPEVPVEAVSKQKPKEDTLRVEKVSRPLSDQTVQRDQLLAYLNSKRSYAEPRGCVIDGFMTCREEGAHIDGSPAVTDEGRYRPHPGTIRGYHE